MGYIWLVQKVGEIHEMDIWLSTMGSWGLKNDSLF